MELENEEIKKYREEYIKNLGNYIEKQIILEQKEKNQEIIAVEDTEEEEELEIRR